MESDAIIKDRLNATAQLFAPGGPDEFAKSIEAQRALIAKKPRTSASRRSRDPEPQTGRGARRDPAQSPWPRSALRP